MRCFKNDFVKVMIRRAEQVTCKLFPLVSLYTSTVRISWHWFPRQVDLEVLYIM